MLGTVSCERKWLLFILIVCIFTFVTAETSLFALTLESSAFVNNEYIPDIYTCSSVNYSPPLNWSDIPQGTKSFALICDDPDAPFGAWVHWVIYNIPVTIHQLDEHLPPIPEFSNGIRQGKNDFHKYGYGGPCPPPGGPHRYFFKLYALDTMLELSGDVSKGDLERAMKGHILDEATLVGLYQR